ncbi:NADPH-dependent FMN reductase [Tricladium varicosporioides]|nr:NADPH-dependent FMN reductase [Hymenoscyphus varicosporioides]
MASQTHKKIAIITGSTRALRIGPQVTAFITSTLTPEITNHPFTLTQVDIAAFNLPVFDEKAIPAAVPLYAQFQYEHSKAWSAEIAKYDGYVLVTACYNAGPPGAIKNAIDYLYNEIKGKPFLIISYGVEGGVAASESLAKSLLSMFVHVIPTKPSLHFSPKEPNAMGLSRDLQLTWEGKLGENSLADWEGKKGEIVKGFGELKEFLDKEGAGNSQLL